MTDPAPELIQSLIPSSVVVAILHNDKLDVRSLHNRDGPCPLKASQYWLLISGCVLYFAYISSSFWRPSLISPLSSLDFYP